MTDPNGVIIPMPRCAAKYNLGVDQWAMCVRDEGHEGQHRSGALTW